MSRINLAAYTEPGINYPPFISINMDEELEVIEVTVRSSAYKDGRCGDAATILLSPLDFGLLLGSLSKTLNELTGEMTTTELEKYFRDCKDNGGRLT